MGYFLSVGVLRFAQDDGQNEQLQLQLQQQMQEQMQMRMRMRIPLGKDGQKGDSDRKS